MPQITIERIDISFDSDDGDDSASFERLFRRLMEQWERERNRRRSEEEHGGGGRGSSGGWIARERRTSITMTVADVDDASLERGERSSGRKDSEPDERKRRG